MNFNSEIELVELLKKALKNQFGKGEIEIFLEVSLGYGIADVVLTRMTKPIEKLRTPKLMLNNCDINIYNLIKKSENISFDMIREITRISNGKISNSLDKLITNKYILAEDYSFSIDSEYELPFIENFAIEAKLKDWKRALKQAYRYRWFAEYSFVVLDDHYASPAIKNIDQFKKYNIGLATLNKEGKIKRYYSPKRQIPFDPKMQILLSEKIINNYEFAR